jgi:prepilin-type N-terminal cleavage/methylation domain-containing protein
MLMPRPKTSGFTLVEMLIVVAIMALLMGILVPVFSRIRTRAIETAVGTQLSALGIGLENFKKDFGYYPKSLPQNLDGISACDNRTEVSTNFHVQGLHRMAFALLGRDRAGCPAQRGTGTGVDTNADRGPDSLTGWYYSGNGSDNGSFSASWQPTANWTAERRTARRGPYINPDNFIVDNDSNVGDFAPVLCDKFHRNSPDAVIGTSAYAAHHVILYFAANLRGNRIGGSPTSMSNADWLRQQYFAADNWGLTRVLDNASMNGAFWNFIRNPGGTVGTDNVSRNPATFLLISPGADGQYFTDDDIKNWAD